MPLVANGKNTALNALKGTNPTSYIQYGSMHTGIPDASGSNELSGGSPAYARKPLSFSAASGGSMAGSTTPSFDIPAGSTVFYVGFWDALTSGNFLGYAPINGGLVIGVGTADSATDKILSNGHGLVNTDRVTLQTVVGESLPAGLSATVVYYVVNKTTNDFQLSLTSGGAAVDITAVGELLFQKVIPEIYGSQGTLTVNTLTVDLNA